MLCDVYILYRSGEALPLAEAEAHPVRGWLCFGDAGRSYPHEEAHLYRSRTDPTEAIPFVDYARVKKIKRGGLRIEGQQEHGYRQYWRQVWWCLPVTNAEQTAGNYGPIRTAVSLVDATGPACALDSDYFNRPARQACSPTQAEVASAHFPCQKPAATLSSTKTE